MMAAKNVAVSVSESQMFGRPSKCVGMLQDGAEVTRSQWVGGTGEGGDRAQPTIDEGRVWSIDRSERGDAQWKGDGGGAEEDGHVEGLLAVPGTTYMADAESEPQHHNQRQRHIDCNCLRPQRRRIDDRAEEEELLTRATVPSCTDRLTR